MVGQATQRPHGRVQRTQDTLYGPNLANIPGGFNNECERELHHITSTADEQGFNGRIYWVAALGFLTDSYNLFASNVILPALCFVYWDTSENRLEYGFNIATLLGSMLGQIGFGIAVDAYGRRALYGFELLIVIISTLGLLQCSEGFRNATGDHTWFITPWLFAWRVVMGVGIGAEYPLSATIAAEWSSKSSRARMMSAVFFTQPLGQFLAYAVSLAALSRLASSKVDIDEFWRIVVGCGALPTIFALLVRRLIRESWRFTYFVVKNPGKAVEDSAKVYTDDNLLMKLQDVTPSSKEWMPGSQFENRAKLAGTAACWFLLDYAFCGMGFNNPGTIAKLWTSFTTVFGGNPPLWLSNSDISSGNFDGTVVIDGLDPTGAVADVTIHAVLFSNITHTIYTTSIAAILGSALFIASGSIRVLFHDSSVVGGHYALIILWALAQFFFNFGPNTLIFILPAEVFPTRYRCTCYGIAAATGKLGAVLVQAITWGLSRGGSASNPKNYGMLQWLMVSFAISMALGGLIALSPSAILNVQSGGRHSESLEMLSDDKIYVPQSAANNDSRSSVDE